MSQAQPVSIKNRSLQCKHCGHGQFVHRNAKLNTGLMEFLDVGWMNRSADVYVCAGCGFLHWFLEPQVEEAAPVLQNRSLAEEAQSPVPPEEPAPPDDLSEASACLSCGQRIPAGSDTCSSCGWSYK
jgi:hypothetical protein